MIANDHRLLVVVFRDWSCLQMCQLSRLVDFGHLNSYSLVQCQTRAEVDCYYIGWCF